MEGNTEERNGTFPGMPLVKPFPFPPNINPARCPTGDFHVGCFYDTQLEHRRWYDEEVPKEDRLPMTPDLCYAFCSKVSGVQYFGVTRGDRCYCTPFFHNTGMNAHGDCDLPCVGDQTRMCGGMERSDVYVLHDCNNLPDLPCKRPPHAPAHAKMFKSNYYRQGSPCANTKREPLTTLQTFCDIECEVGFFLAKNEIRCMRKGDPLGYSWAQVTGSAICRAISCGKPPDIAHTTHPGSPAQYGMPVPYSCQLGYSLDSSPKGPKDFILMCGNDGGFNTSKDLGCYKVECGTCPEGDKYNNSKVAEKGKKVYTDQCTYQCDVGYTLDALPKGKSSFKLTCLATGEFSEPKTCLPVSCGAGPIIANSKKLTEGVVVYPNAAEYVVDEGYTMIGKVKAGQKFYKKCQSDGKFSDIIPPDEWTPPACPAGRSCDDVKPKIDPVPCGKAPKVENSLYDDGDYHFGQALSYTCLDGYTTTGKSDGDAKAEVACGPLGKYLWKEKESPMPECLPVECGEAPKKEFAKMITELKTAVVTAASPVLVYECDPGYSTSKEDDPYEPQHAAATVTCLGTGEFTKSKECVNINDCTPSHCGRSGKCVDIDPPTAKPFDNYECDCDAGFMQITEKGSPPGDDAKVCVNINDCPSPIEEACGGENKLGMRRGICEDGLMTYTCTPSEGYKVITEGKNETCVPKECGDVPKVKNSKSPMDGKKADYDTEPWKYTCNEGYSLTGKYGDKTEFDCRCTAAAKFSTLKKCLAVSCGSAHSVEHTIMSPRVEVVYFPTKLTYTADPGYSLTGKIDGSKTFEVECKSDGTQTKPKKMLPVECGSVPKQKFATYDSKKVLVFKEYVTVKCDTGYSTDETPHPNSLFYDVTCEADGKLKIPGECKYITIPLKDHPIDCGKPPDVVHSTISGSQLFGGKITYTAVEGYSLDGSTAEEQKSFDIKCLPTEVYTETRTFQRISCGPSLDVEFTKSVTFVEAKGKSFFQSANAFNADSIKDSDEAHKTFPMLFGDAVKYVCMEGYKIPKMGKKYIGSRNPDTLVLKCDGKGQIVPTKPNNPAAIKCMPVNCFAPNKKKCKNCEANLKGNDNGNVLEFKDEQEFVCDPGYNLDGTPIGETDYIETCQANGALTKDNACEDIDWCLDSQCGGKGVGTCVDGLFDYRCNCAKGFEEISVPGGHKKCVQIDECITQDGNKFCAGDGGDYGKCVDKILRYKCECEKGYEVTKLITGEQQCTAIFCPSIEDRKFSSSEMVGQKMQYKDSASYTCKPGYSTDGDKDGVKQYTVKCLIDGDLSKVDDCKPVACPCIDGSCVPAVKNGEWKGSFDKALVFGESAKFKCSEGYTTTGHPAGLTSFTVSCTAEASLTKAGECLPVECGRAPEIANALVGEEKVLVFKDVVTITCAKGYTTDGEPKGKTSFDFECLATGKLKGEGACVPVTCGTPKAVKHAEHSMRELYYTDQVRVLCHSGYSVDADANGESSFVGTCSADGTISGMIECKAVSCGVPKAEVGSSSKSPETFFGESATWNCLPGFSTDGVKNGATKFVRPCLEHGTFGKSSPDKCVDVDFCLGNPCTSNGVCTDLGAGKVDPGYSCECAEGYEIKQKPDGSPTCTEDDCHGNPCGDGGTCTDLSKLAKIEGAYACECELGYELDETKPNEPTCVRTKCGDLPTDILNILMAADLPDVVIETWNKKPSEKNKGVPIMKAGDSAQFTCAKGYSTDGKYTKESKDFTIRCENSGLYHRPIVADSECVLIKCDNWQRPMVPYASSPTPKEGFYEYGDKIVFQCDSGYTTNGKVKGPKTFEIECTADSTFSPVHDSCLPISCRIPKVDNSKPSSGFQPVKFGKRVVYTCSEGYVAQGTKSNSFAGSCGAKGKLEFDGASSCVPIECGTPEDQPSAKLFVEAEHVLLASLNTSTNRSGLFKKVTPGLVQTHGDLVPFPEGRVMTTVCAPVVVECNDGFTIGGISGGSTKYSIECQSTGKLIAMSGNSKMYEICDQPKFQVSGIATDAQSASIYLSSTTVKFIQDGNIMASATTSYSGRYTASLAAGTYTIEASKSGYITYKAEIVVVSSISAGGAGDVALSKVLPEGEWRVTINWAAHSRDLDSHTYLGKDAKDLVYFGRKTRRDSSTGISATLDRDDVNGYGPETTTFKGIGKCTKKSNCLVKFMVDNYTPKDKDIGLSECIITLYRGSSTVKKYTLPVAAGSARIWPIFTLDSAKDTQQVLSDGDQIYGPILGAPPIKDSNRKNVGGGMDGPGCVKLESSQFQLLAGFKASSFDGLNRIQELSYATVEDSTKMECQEVDWFESESGWSGDGGFSTCPTGSYLAGFCRVGSRYDDTRGPKQITKGYCCKPKELADEWGACHNAPLFEEVGWSQCSPSEEGRQTVMVGLQMKYGSLPGDQSLKALSQAKCCELHGGGMIPNPKGTGDDDGDGGGYDDYGSGGYEYFLDQMDAGSW